MGREVALTSAAWMHIMAEHGELAGRVADIRAAVESPEIVTRDRIRAHREVHYRRTRSGHHWLRVVVNYGPVPPQGTWAGTVITAHVIREPERKEVRIWP